jgi:biopolymer transport protein ExbD
VIWIGDTKLKDKNKFDELFTKVDTNVSKTPTVPVIIDPDINVPFQDIIAVLNVCRKVQQKTYGKELQIKFSAKALAEK